jgi:hypothetical protein
MVIHKFELVHNRIIVVGVGQDDLIFELGFSEVLI